MNLFQTRVALAKYSRSWRGADAAARSIRINLGATFAGRTSEIFHDDDDDDGCVLANEAAPGGGDFGRLDPARRVSRIKDPGCPQGHVLSLLSLAVALAFTPEQSCEIDQHRSVVYKGFILLNIDSTHKLAARTTTSRYAVRGITVAAADLPTPLLPY